MDKIVFVYGDWCSYCKDMDRVLDGLSDISIEKVNVETEQDKLFQYLEDGEMKIESVPFFIFESDGMVIRTYAGPVTAEIIYSIFNR